MALKPRVKEFIEHYIHLIENNQFNELYVEAENYLDTSEIHLLTESLINPEINLQVLSNMYYVPKYYLATNTDITAVELPDSIKIVRARAFDKCLNLQEIILPESVEVVDAYAFANCPSLKTLIVKNPECSFSTLSTVFSKNITVHCKAESKVEIWTREVWKYPIINI